MPEPPDPEETALLIQQMASGDEVAFRVLWHGMERPIRALGARYLGSDAEGEEVAQETFLKLWRSAAAFDPGRGSARTWIYGVARNVARDRLRRRRVRWVVGLDALPNDPADDTPGTEDVVGARQGLAQVRDGIANLPDRQRMALLLASLGGLETPEIADIMGTTRGAVEQLLVRARARLRQMTGKDGDG